MLFANIMYIIFLSATASEASLTLLERIVRSESASYLTAADLGANASTQSTVTELSTTRRPPPIDSNDSETKKTVVVGVVAVGLLLLMACLTQFRRSLAKRLCCCCCREEENEKEIEDESVKTPEASDEIYVHYDLWEREPEVKTVSGTIARLTSQPTRHVRPKDSRSVTSYRRSFRQFVKEKGGSSSENDGLPHYYDITKNVTVLRDPPPSYGDLAATSGSAGHVNETFTSNEAE